MKKKNKEKKIKEKKPNKFFEFIKKTVLSDFTLTLLLIGIIVCVYVILNSWIESLNIKDIDLTTEKLYTLSQESKDKVSNVQNDTKILFLGMSGYDTAKDLAKQYERVNNKIKFEEVDDINSRPDLISKYGLGDSSSNASGIIVETGERQKILTERDLSTYDYTTYETIDISEEALTNAILDVNLEKKPKIYVLTSHSTYSKLLTYAKTYLENEANEVEELNLIVNGSIPEDCNVLMIASLNEDITEAEKTMLLDYINKGGKLLIAQDANYENKAMPNYQAVLDVYGVSIANGIVFETDASKIVNGSANIILPELSYSSDITQYMASERSVVIFQSASKLNFKSDEELTNLGVEKEELVTLSDGAYLRTDLNITTANKTNSDVNVGGETVGALITKTINDDTKSQLIIYATSSFMRDPIQSNNYINYGILLENNRDLILNSISYLTQRTDTITIRKDMGTVTFNATADQTLKIAIVIIALPIIILVVGIIVWRKRRRRK